MSQIGVFTYVLGQVHANLLKPSFVRELHEKYRIPNETIEQLKSAAEVFFKAFLDDNMQKPESE